MREILIRCRIPDALYSIYHSSPANKGSGAAVFYVDTDFPGALKEVTDLLITANQHAELRAKETHRDHNGIDPDLFTTVEHQ